MSNKMNPTTVVTGDVRLSYVHLFTPYANQPGQEPKYSVTLLIPKSDVATKQRIDAAINASIIQGVSGKWNGTRPPQVKNPVWDGDGVRQNGEPFGDECKGHWVITASSKSQQQIVDGQLNPIINQSEIYSGIYARVSINFFPYFNSGNKGVGCGLGPVQKRSDGEPLGGTVTAESAFGDSAALPYNQPTYAAAPQQSYAQPVYQQPAYQQPMQQGYAPQPQYQQPPIQQYQQQIDPITGAPITGGVMGL